MKNQTSTFTAILLILVCYMFSQKTWAVSPAPDGGYPNGNTAEGQNALFSLTTGGYNTAVGFFSLFATTYGSFNTAVGAGALDLNSGNNNTANGAAALLLNTTGSFNTAVGSDTLVNNATGNSNTAVGGLALQYNTANGNTAVGVAALHLNTTGDQNVAVGNGALQNNTTGHGNIAVGFAAGHEITTGGSLNIDIGNLGVAGDSGIIRIGDSTQQGQTFVAGVYGVSVAGLQVVMNSSNQLGTAASSRRFKEDIKPMDDTSEAVLALNPVTFRYKKNIDPTGTSQFGLVAEDVAKVNPDLVVRDKEGKPYSVRYDAVNAMLLNEFLKEHRIVQEQQATITQLKKDFRATIAHLTTRLDEQAAQIQKVSAQLEASKPAPQIVKTTKLTTTLAMRPQITQTDATINGGDD